MKTKGYTVKAHIEHTLPSGGRGFAEFTMGMDGNFYLAISAWSTVKPATFRTKQDASEFYFEKRKECLASSPFIEGPKGGRHHIIQWR